MDQYDAVYLGAGLAAHFHALRHGKGKKILFLDRDNPHDRRHSLCFWRTKETIADPFIEKTWNQWVVGDAIQTSKNMPYCLVFSDTFLRHLKAKIEESASCTWRLSEKVDDHANYGCKVYDSRMSWSCYEESTMIQDFYETMLESDEPIFEETSAWLMNFIPETKWIHFFYVLPFSKRKALVTSTAFTMQPIEKELHISLIRKHFQQEPKQGIHKRLPMGFLKEKNQKLGIAGGHIRASTGYTFWQNLTQREPSERWMDRLFLSLLKKYPEKGPSLFTKLFKACPPDKLIPFLQGEGGVKEKLCIVKSLPKWFFIKGLLFNEAPL